eukprot:6196833-Pleurochrysis_carterae.AAC.1
MQRASFSWSLEQDKKGSNATWREGKKRALHLYADATYGPGGRPFRLVSRADHSAFKKCSRCKELRIQLAELLKNCRSHQQVAAAKKSQKEDSDWFLAQRQELSKMRFSGEQRNTVFEQAYIKRLCASLCRRRINAATTAFTRLEVAIEYA